MGHFPDSIMLDSILPKLRAFIRMAIDWIRTAWYYFLFKQMTEHKNIKKLKIRLKGNGFCLFFHLFCSVAYFMDIHQNKKKLVHLNLI